MSETNDFLPDDDLFSCGDSTDYPYKKTLHLPIVVKPELPPAVASSVRKIMDAPRLHELTTAQIEQIAKATYVDTLKKDFEKELDKANLGKEKLDRYISQWLAAFSSKNTIRSFRLNLELFLTWLGNRSVLEVDALMVDQYVSYLNSDRTLSANTKRQRIAACSSFFSDLERWRVIFNNPFRKAKGLPKKKIAIKMAEDIPSNAELDAIESYARAQIREAQSGTGSGVKKKLSGSIHAYCALRILREYGLRVGALSRMKIDRTGAFTSVSKGKEISGTFDCSILALLKEHNLPLKIPFGAYSEKAFSVWLWRAQASASLSDKVLRKYSPHSIRHRFAIDFYTRTKDIHALSKRLGHSSLLVTSAYLSGFQDSNNQ